MRTMSPQKPMKKRIHRTALVRPLLTIGLASLLALFGAALTYSTPPALEGANGVGVFFNLQPTSTPKPQDLSEIGSTDAIVFMGFLIALIVIVPIVARRKFWMEPRA